MNEPWYRKAFGSFYPELYGHRNREEAEQGVTLLASLTELDGARVLDLACGAGRYLAILRLRKAAAIGVDLSADLLARASLDAPVIRGDMRAIPCRAGSFHGVVSMFTSFGYFPDGEENLAVFREVARALRPGGWFFFDFLHSKVVLDTLVPEGERMIGPYRVREQRSYQPATRILTKKVDVLGGAKEQLQWEERLFLFTPAEIEEGLSAAGFAVRRRFGDYEGRDFTGDSKRLVLYSLLDSAQAAD